MVLVFGHGNATDLQSTIHQDMYSRVSIADIITIVVYLGAMYIHIEK